MDSIWGNLFEIFYQVLFLTRVAQVARLATHSQKKRIEWDPPGMITTYVGYPKTIVANSDLHDVAQNQADKFQWAIVIWNPQASTLQAKI